MKENIMSVLGAIKQAQKIKDSKVKDVEPREGESKEDFISRFMSETESEYPDEKQRLAVAYSYWNRAHDSVDCTTVQCYIFDNAGRILIQDRVGPEWKGYAVPGGHVKPGESTIDTCIREVKEETGLDVSELQQFGESEYTSERDGHCKSILYRTNRFSGDLHDSEEGEMFWMKVEDVKNSDKCAEGFKGLLQDCCGITAKDSKVYASNDEILNKLIGEEEDAITSYEAAMNMTDNDELRQLLGHIKDEEKEHLEELQNAKHGHIEIMDADDYVIKANYGHYEIYKNGKLIGSEDTYGEAKKEIERLEKEGK